ncbi:TIGR02588 family protein [Agrobacterium salinitolerans]|uniref:TIGR02588 family protein n=1 Tax=Agrobacterium salinitolerans TaxID=1183413 RepID=A0A9X3KNS7_9HYPH|nr:MULTISPECIES: TIGR02588 family protein [Agrobacterium]MCZ7854773.1 TIGR02588 family protein [Agrobacterium salinitolerans]MCZ7863529.1 TIGR02588 family protein [Agrobacterium salinitolerans]MCZ7893540.1 TIGR02588 family protein [Agrobacterium salinitolerans]MCZ7938164.1 TIGR02588 family protein [Agrobacterium salinitolerans]MCZ7973347.1 TIGR02588 family protein [Agrobacterium salinitolerans]
MTISKNGKQMESADPHWIEWVTGTICTLLVAAMLGSIGYDIYRYRPEDARFDIAVTGVEGQAGQYRVKFDIRNLSMTTAAQVQVRGDLQQNDATLESADVTFDYVASESRDTGTLFFRNDPRSATLTINVAGYTEP